MIRFRTIARPCLPLLAAFCLLTLPVSAQEIQISAAVEPGQLLSPQAEAFVAPQPLRQALLTSAVGTRLHLASFPVSPLERAEVELQRVSVYAPGARIFVIDENGTRQLQRSTLLHYRGGSADGAIEIAFSVDPANGKLRGAVAGPAGLYDLEPGEGDTQVIQLQDSSGSYSCTNEQLSAELLSLGGSPPLAGPPSLDPPRIAAPEGLPFAITAAAGAGPAYQATIGVDTDVEWLSEYFSNNTSSAGDWIANLFNQMNLMYERDLSLRLLVGDTFLRVGNAGSDPWTVEGSGASGNALNEFSGYWASNMSGVDRVFAMLLSGKSSSGGRGSGIAWVGFTYCSSSVGYSVTQTLNPSFLSTNARLIGHEVGHNAGSSHTHCYSPPVDQCYNGQAMQGCYSGPESCPAEGSGTVMSYCHTGACGSTPVRAEFHPTVIDYISPLIDAAAPSCVEPLASIGDIFTDGFESGNTSAWTL